MADSRSARHKIVHDRTIPSEEEGWRLGGWVFFSCLLHGMLISGLFVFPRVPFPKAPEYPVYTVDLLGGEKLGGRTLGSQVVTVAPPKPKPEPKPVKVEKPPPPVPETKNKAAVQEEKVVLKEAKKEAKKEPPKEVKKEAVKEPEPNQRLPEELRAKMRQAALDRVKSRVEAQRKKDEEEQALQSGPGEGEGADAPGEGGKGGGKIVKGVEFLIYRNRMLYLIRESWTWVGKRNDLEVKVRFGIQENGDIVGLRIMQPSGDLSYDNSVFRAIKKASPLPPPPENYREEFMEVNLTFLPKDLGN